MNIPVLKEKLKKEHEVNGQIQGWYRETAKQIGISDQVLNGILSGKFRGEYKTWQLIEKYLNKEN